MRTTAILLSPVLVVSLQPRMSAQGTYNDAAIQERKAYANSQTERFDVDSDAKGETRRQYFYTFGKNGKCLGVGLIDGYKWTKSVVDTYFNTTRRHRMESLGFTHIMFSHSVVNPRTKKSELKSYLFVEVGGPEWMQQE